jgi:hypothetical protein
MNWKEFERKPSQQIRGTISAAARGDSGNTRIRISSVAVEIRNEHLPSTRTVPGKKKMQIMKRYIREGSKKV